VGAAKVATGHTLDDRVETTLARLVHGGATDQLASIPAHEGVRIRPLIEVRRRETREYCESNGLDYLTDPANDDPRFERARVRASLKGAIEEGWGEGAIRAMASAADRFREDSVALGGLLDRIFGSLIDPAEDEVRIDRAAFEGLPKALQRRALERVVGAVRDRGKAIDAALQALEGNPKPGSRFAVAAGSEIVIERDNLVVTTATGGLDGSL
jgi:tRNA(Ile)-lysidine synthase